jgi:NAD(P)-dependent dehydrogenase (short-subunit alcohol dehydrogenase family)
MGHSQPLGLLEDKVILVVGATSGIGAATAVEAAKEGAIVILSGRRKEKGQEVVNKITKLGKRAHFIYADATKEEDVKVF